MLTLINASVIFAFGLVIVGIVVLGLIQAREQAQRAAVVDAFTRRENPPTLRRVA